jgi:hypothetical protein
MTEEIFDTNEQHQYGKKQLSLWYCESCRMVHLRAGKTVLNFDTREFAEFVEAVVDIHYSSGWQMSQWALPVGEEKGEILARDLIA